MYRRAFTLLLLAGCAHYTPRPLDLAATSATYAVRSLDDTLLARALTGAGAPAEWNAYRLAEAAWWLRAERARSDAEVRVAEAALITAGARPDPGAGVNVERSFSGRDGSSPWGIGAGPSFTVELGGKRQARQERARAAVVAAHAAQASEARMLRGRVHAAALGLTLATRARERSESRAALFDTLLSGIRRRFEDGALPRLEVARAEQERQDVQIEVLHRRRDTELAAADLATAVGIPPEALASIPVHLGTTPTCRGALGDGRDSLRTRALTQRPELGAALAAYLGAEADVRSEVANSWPDLVLGPGLLFDHGVGKWTIGFGLPALAFNRRRGPIAEAEARRAVAGTQVVEMQQRILLEVDSAVALCRAAEAESAALEPMYASTAERASVSREAYLRGETGALEVSQARLLALGAIEEREAALARVALAALAVEEVSGDWRPSQEGEE